MNCPFTVLTIVLILLNFKSQSVFQKVLEVCNLHNMHILTLKIICFTKLEIYIALDNMCTLGWMKERERHKYLKSGSIPNK